MDSAIEFMFLSWAESLCLRMALFWQEQAGRPKTKCYKLATIIVIFLPRSCSKKKRKSTQTFIAADLILNSTFKIMTLCQTLGPLFSINSPLNLSSTMFANPPMDQLGSYLQENTGELQWTAISVWMGDIHCSIALHMLIYLTMKFEITHSLTPRWVHLASTLGDLKCLM